MEDAKKNKRKLQVFVSSTYLDLKEERQAAIEAILKAGHIPAGMELFTAGDKSQWEVIQQWIEESDVFVLLLGGRYGSIEKTENKSYIELEYRYAVEKTKHHFVLIATDDFIDQNIKKINTQDQNEKLNYNRYIEFKQELGTKYNGKWGNKDQLKLELTLALKQFEEKDSEIGWIKADQIQNKINSAEINALRSEIEILKQQNLDLEEQIEKYKSNKEKEISNEDFAKYLNKLKFSIIEFNNSPEGIKRVLEENFSIDKETLSSLTYKDILPCILQSLITPKVIDATDSQLISLLKLYQIIQLDDNIIYDDFNDIYVRRPAPAYQDLIDDLSIFKTKPFYKLSNEGHEFLLYLTTHH